MAILVEGKARRRRQQWPLDAVVLVFATCVLLPAVEALTAVPWARGMLAWTLPAAAGAGYIVGLLLVALPVYRRWWLVMLGALPLLAAATLAGVIVSARGAGSAQTGFGMFLLGGYTAALGALIPWLVVRAKQTWLAVVAAWITVAGAWGTQLTAQQVWWAIWLLLASVTLIGVVHLTDEKRIWDANGLERLGPVLWPAARAIAGISLLVAAVGLLPLGASRIAELSSLWARTPAGHAGPLTYTDPHGTPVAVLGAPLRLDAPDVSSNQIILTYTVLDGPIVTPPLLGATLDTFDGTTWTQGPGVGEAPLHGALPAPKGAQSLTVRITVYALPQSDRGTYVLGFDQARSFSVPVSVRLVGGQEPTALSIASWQTSQPIKQGTSYTVDSTIVTDDVAAEGTMPPTELQRLLQLPTPVDPAATRLAQQWVGAATTPRAQAEALLEGLAKDVTFDAGATPPAGEDVVTWTLQNRRANAVALTTTYIMLGRALGLPLRLAEGYLPGHYDSALKQMVVRGSDAAVWAQLAVPGVGWLDLFPASNEVTIAVPSRIVYTGVPTPTPVQPTKTPVNTQAQQKPGQRTPVQDLQVFSESGWLLSFLAAGVVLLLLVVVALGVVRWRWSRFGAQFAPLGQFFARVGLLARLGGIALRPSDTSTQATGKVVAVVPSHRDTLVSLNGTYERVRYGPPHGQGAIPNLREQWRRLSGALWRLVLTRPWRHRHPGTRQSGG